jgi:hypothetical protein
MFMVGESDKHPRTLKDGVYVTLTTQLTEPARLDRLLLILAIAYLLLCGIGLIAQSTLKSSAWSSSSRDTASIFQIGLLMVEKITASPPQALAAIFHLSETVAGKWG